MAHAEVGAFQVARKLFSSELWTEKPLSWKVVWIYILGNVNHKDNGKLKRGEGFFNFSRDHKLIGIDITEDMIKKFLHYARQTHMLSTKRSTRGTIVKVINYNEYQTLNNYVSTTPSTLPSTREAREKHYDTKECKNVKNEKKEHLVDFETFWDAYPRKTDKIDAKKVWEKKRPSIREILPALEAQKKSEQWQDKQFIPGPARWLRGEKWNDVLPEKRIKKQALNSSDIIPIS